jgi:hypothetical protein
MVMISPLQNLYNLRMARALPPAGGAGLSSLPPGPEAVLPAQSTDPIDDGIKTLMAYGRQATGQGLDSLISPTGMPVRRMSNGGAADDDGVGTSETEAAGSTSGGESAFGDGSGSGDYSYSGDEYGPDTQAAVDALAQSYGNYGIDYTQEYGALDPNPARTDPGGRRGELIADLGFLGSITKGDLTTAFSPENIAITMAKVAPSLLGLPNPVGLYSTAKTLGAIATALGFPGKTQTASEAVAEQEAMAGVGGGNGDPWIRPYGDPYNAPKPVVSEPTPTEPDSFFRRQAQTPLTLADIVGYATGQSGYQGGFPRFLQPVVAAQGGGISALAYGGDTAPTGYGNPAFEGMVPGTGTGMSDSVPFSIEGQQPALLSRDEYVLPADVVSQLGDGSSGAGADMLNNFVSQVRHSKYGQTQQPPANGGGLMSALMRHGGIV